MQETKTRTETAPVKVGQTYGNRFATQELQADGTWIVYNEVTGLPVGEWVGETGERNIRYYKTYSDARGEVVAMYQHYRSLE
jgi:hypothetical protein